MIGKAHPSPAASAPLVRARIAELQAALNGGLPRHPDAKAKLERALTGLAGLAFEAGRAFERQQWGETLAEIPGEAREAHAAGLWQALQACEGAGSVQEVKDRLMAISIHVAPVWKREGGGG